MPLDTKFDFRDDSNGRDPDIASATLKLYHQLLWSKPLPSGEPLGLKPMSGAYLTHSSDLGDFWLSSDAISNSMRGSKRLAGVVAQIPSVKLDAFQALGATIGARILFPGNRIGSKQTINAARGCHPRIADRFDLTLECIRLHYLGQPSPLTALFERYASFFSLFETFEGYVEFFLLDDLLQNGQVRFYLPFDGFARSALPQDVAEYEFYMQNTMSFVSKRNARIDEWVRRNGDGDVVEFRFNV